MEERYYSYLESFHLIRINPTYFQFIFAHCIMFRASLKSTGLPPLIHHQNATCGVSCGSIPLRRMTNTTPGAAAPIFEIGLPCIWHLAGDQELIEMK